MDHLLFRRLGPPPSSPGSPIIQANLKSLPVGDDLYARRGTDVLGHGNQAFMVSDGCFDGGECYVVQEDWRISWSFFGCVSQKE